jgi:hypothetical protein
VAVLALAGEALGIGGSQALVGAGMALGIGIMQGRDMRRILGKAAPWIVSTVVGMTWPFLLMDILKAAHFEVAYSLQLCVAIGGFSAGTWQAFILRSRFRRTGSWVVASAIGWMLAAGMAALADFAGKSHAIRGVSGALAYLGLIGLGGGILGLVTRISLASMLRQERAA